MGISYRVRGYSSGAHNEGYSTELFSFPEFLAKKINLVRTVFDQNSSFQIPESKLNLKRSSIKKIESEVHFELH